MSRGGNGGPNTRKEGRTSYAYGSSGRVCTPRDATNARAKAGRAVARAAVRARGAIILRVLRIPLALCLGILGALLRERANASAVAMREIHAHARTAYSQLLAVVAVVVNVEGSSRYGSRQAGSSPPYVRPPLTRPSRRFGAWRADRDMTSCLRGRSEEGRRASRFNFPTRTSMAGRGFRLSGVAVWKRYKFEQAGSLHYIHQFNA